MSLELITFPEELLERILSLCVIAPLVQSSRPQWHQSPNSAAVRGRLAPLLVSKKFYRIATPLFYHTIHITSPPQLHQLLSTAIRPNLHLATHVRRLIFAGVWAEGGELLSMCHINLKMLDITLDVTHLAPGVHPIRDVRDLDAEDFCEGLKDITKSLTHFALRKPNQVYLTQPKPKYVLGEIARAMRNWDNLELADIAFRLSDDSGLGPLISNLHHLSIQPQGNAPEPQGPITSLTRALTTRPKLRTFCTLLPSLWNESILRVSTNPNLESIVLGDGSSRPREYTHSRTTSLTGKILDGGAAYDGGIVGTGLFLMQARKYARLSDLIRAGTSIIRTRAHTMGNPSSSPPPSCPRSRSSASPPVNYARSQSMIPTSSGSSPNSPRSNASSTVSTSTSTSPTSHKHQQRQVDNQIQTRAWNYQSSQQQHHHRHHHHPNTANSPNSSRVTYGPDRVRLDPYLGH